MQLHEPSLAVYFTFTAWTALRLFAQLQMIAMTLLRLHGVCVRKGTLEQEWNRFLFIFRSKNKREIAYRVCYVPLLNSHSRTSKRRTSVKASFVCVRRIHTRCVKVAWCRCRVSLKFKHISAQLYQVNKRVFLHLQTFASSEMPSLQLNLLQFFSRWACARERNLLQTKPTWQKLQWELFLSLRILSDIHAILSSAQPSIELLNMHYTLMWCIPPAEGIVPRRTC